MKIKSLTYLIVLSVAFLNHFLTFLAYDWYAGVDAYSYDVCGLQLVSGQIFDVFPILFRPPLIPIVKNILYLIFEGHPYGLSIFMHSIGIGTALLAYRLGSRFHKLVGFGMGMLMALYLPISVYFHHISVPTLFIPLLILAADCFVSWIKKPNAVSGVILVMVTVLCCLTRSEAMVLILVFWIFAWFAHRRWVQPAFFLLMCIIIYNFICLFYYTHFKYWGITYNTGYALFTRISRPKDSQFATSNGPASQKVYEYMNKEWPQRVKDFAPREFQLFTFNLAQQDLGYIEADSLFKQAALEAIFSDPAKFIKFTVLRILGQLDLYYLPGLSFKEFIYETESGHMWGFKEERMKRNQEFYEKWLPIISTLDSPLQWEKRVIKAKLYRMLGLKSEIPPLPDSFQLRPNVMLGESKEVIFLNCGDDPMQERLWSCLNLDVYFNLAYWGQRNWSKRALKILEDWDMFMPGTKLRMNLHRIMWALWIMGIFISRRERWYLLTLSAFLCSALLFAVSQAVFSDNFGGRFSLYFLPYLWLGGLCGFMSLLKRVFRTELF